MNAKSFLIPVLLAVFALVGCELDSTLDELPNGEDTLLSPLTDNEIRYTTTDGKVIELNSREEAPTDPFGNGVYVVRNDYNNGVGILTLSGPPTQIDTDTFLYCENLKSINIPNSVLRIGADAFGYCPNLEAFYGKFASEDHRCLITNQCIYSYNNYEDPQSENFYIWKEGTAIAAFASAGITEYSLPDNIETIGWGAFRSAMQLKKIHIPDSVMTIGYYAFAECSSLESITIPDSVTEIGGAAFADCTSLASITIPDSITEIGSGAFAGCSSLESITIPRNVTKIGVVAFGACDSLKSVYCKAVNPPILEESSYGGYSHFDYNAAGRKIYVPQESVEAYKTAEGWRSYANDIFGYDFSNE